MAAQIIKVDPFDLVVFGGTGDLAYRKLYPGAVPSRQERTVHRADPHHRRLAPASRRRRVPRDRARRAGEIQRRRRRQRRARALSLAHSTMSRSTRRATRAGRELKALLDGDERIRAFYLATGPDLFAPSPSASARKAWSRRARASSSRSRSARTAHSADGDQRRARRGLHRAEHLPHRPLSRQGDGAEPDGAALRQRAVRAAVEHRAYRPRADHGGRDARRRGARRLLRPVRRAARHGAEPHAAAPLSGRDGAAALHGRRRGARREAEGAEGADADQRGATPRPSRCAANTAPASPTAAPVPGYLHDIEQGREQHRDLRRAEDRRSPTGAGRACRSICAPASGCRSASPRSSSASSASRTAIFDMPHDAHPRQPARHPRPAGRGHQALADDQGSRAGRHAACSMCRST